MGSLFILSTVSFVMQKLLNLIRQVPLAFFFFFFYSSGLYSYQWLWSALRRKHWLYLYFHGWLYSCDHIKILRKWLEI